MRKQQQVTVGLEVTWIGNRDKYGQSCSLLTDEVDPSAIMPVNMCDAAIDHVCRICPSSAHRSSQRCGISDHHGPEQSGIAARLPSRRSPLIYAHSKSI